MTGSELDPRTPAYIKSGDVVGVTSASFWVQGYAAGRILYEQIAHEKYLDYKGWIDSGTQVVTKANIDAIHGVEIAEQSGDLLRSSRKKAIFANLKAALGPYT